MENGKTTVSNVDEQKIEALASLLSTDESVIKLYLGQPLSNDELAEVCEMAAPGSYVGLKSLKLLIKQTDVSEMLLNSDETLQSLDNIIWLIELHGLEVETDEIGQAANQDELDLANKISAIAIRLEIELDMAYKDADIETLNNAINDDLFSIIARSYVGAMAYDVFCDFFLKNYNNPEVLISLARRTQGCLVCDSEAESDVARRLAELDPEMLQKAVNEMKGRSELSKEEQDRMDGTGVAHYSGSGEDQQITSQSTNVSVI